MERIELINMFVSRGINPSISELIEYHHWINYNPAEIDQKKSLLDSYLANGIVIKATEMMNIYNWAYPEIKDCSEDIKSDDISINTFIAHMKDEIFDNSPSIFTRASKWIIGKDFKNVSELVAFGPERMSKEFSIGPRSVAAVRNNLKKFYGIQKW